MEKTFSTLPVSSSSDTLADAVVDATPRKLDAEDYHAEDQEGVTQSLFGSGNLNYLTLQGRQTDALLSGSGMGAATNKGEMDMLAGGIAGGGSHRFLEGAASRASHDGGDSDISSAAAISGITAGTAARNLQSDALMAKDSFGTQSAATAPASAFSSAAGTDSAPHDGRDARAAHDGVDGNSGHDGAAGSAGPAGDIGTNGTSGVNGANGTDGSGGTDGTDGDNGGGINIVINVPGGDGEGSCILEPVINTVTHVINNAGDTVTHVVNNVTDTATTTVNNLTETVTQLPDTLTQVVGDTTTLVTEIVHSVPDILTSTTETVTSIYNTVLPDTLETVGTLVEQLPPVVGDVIGAVPDTLEGILTPLAEGVADIPQTLDTLVDGLTGGAVDLPPIVDTLADTVSGTVAEVPELLHDVLDPLSEGGLPDLGDVAGQVVDLAGGLVGGLLGGSAPGDGDTDLMITNDMGLPQVDVILDPVESIVGDIDVNLGVTHDDGSLALDLGAQALGIELPEITVDTASVTGGDVDVSVLNGMGLPDVGIGLDPVESIVGDIDVTLGIAQDSGDAGIDLSATALGVTLPEVGLNASGLTVGASADATDTDLLATNDLGLPQLDVNLDPVESIVGDIDLTLGMSHDQDSLSVDLNTLALGTQLPEVTVDTGVPEAGSDTDLSILNDLGLPQLNVGLDPVESVTGDIDVSAGITHDADSLSIDLNVLALGDSLPPVEVTVPTDIAGDTVGDIVDTTADTLSGIEDLAATVQSTADTAVDLLTSGSTDTGIVQTVTDTVSTDLSAAASWTETTITDTASTVGGLVDTVVSGTGLDAALPEPTGVVSSGLSLLSSVTDTSHSGGGLLGHHGGLF